KAKANWLYLLKEWDNVLSLEERVEIKKQYNVDNTAVSQKVGRNDPCPCGSGKKYKKCCGQ
ncbi:MAG TPA: SEC-C metal-binding domain-containing protein, partial [Clostridia bacterium]|nr:SEC-C metal-binding domain-containing protein [Clostridia bacterium]